MRTRQDISRNLFGKKTRALLAAGALGLFVSFTAGVTHAGFQWVPPVKQSPASAIPAPAEASPAQAVPQTDVEQTVLPMPEEVPPAGNTAAPAPPQTLSLPSDYQAQTLAPPPAPVQKPVMQVRQIALAAQEAPASLPPAAASPAVTTKVIMPEDAPQTAMDKTPNSQRLVINPYPAREGQLQSEPMNLQPLHTSAPDTGSVTPTAGLPASDQVPPPAPADFSIVEGFGSDMPLALALQQIAPPNYAFSFDPAVNPGQKVSWEGGKPWNQVINDMVAPLQMEALIKGRVIHIRQSGSQRSEAAPAPEVGATASLRRGNIKDPGEQIAAAPQASARPADENSFAGTEPAAGHAESDPSSAQQQTLSAVENNETPSAEDVLVPLTAPPAPAPQWQAKAGESLKEILARWSEKAGVELLWMASYDYKINQDITVEDDFGKAVQTVIAKGLDNKNAPVERIVQSSAGKPATLLVQDKG